MPKVTEVRDLSISQPLVKVWSSAVIPLAKTEGRLLHLGKGDIAVVIHIGSTHWDPWTYIGELGAFIIGADEPVVTVDCNWVPEYPAGLRYTTIKETPSTEELDLSLHVTTPDPIIDDEDDQSWFWTEEWQAGEREADEDLAAGRIIPLTREDIRNRRDALRKKNASRS